MSHTLSITGYAGKKSPEFQKHYEAVQLCVKHGLSFPKETSEFFRGKICGENLEDFQPHIILEELENGVYIPFDVSYNEKGETIIDVTSLPKELESIIVKWS